MAQTILLLYAIANEKTVKLIAIDRMPAASKTYTVQKHSPIIIVGILYLISCIPFVQSTSYTLDFNNVNVIAQSNDLKIRRKLRDYISSR